MLYSYKALFPAAITLLFAAAPVAAQQRYQQPTAYDNLHHQPAQPGYGTSTSYGAAAPAQPTAPTSRAVACTTDTWSFWYPAKPQIVLEQIDPAARIAVVSGNDASNQRFGPLRVVYPRFALNTPGGFELTVTVKEGTLEVDAKVPNNNRADRYAIVWPCSGPTQQAMTLPAQAAGR